MSSEALAKSICESAIKKAIGKSHDLKKKIISWVEIFRRCRNSCCHFLTSLFAENFDDR